ncbi:GDP/UDP-N,N'-diacetylbacillosamine 2-epimerase (hydrolysing) [Succinivibrio dextrinosolvens]|uniref:UDP-N-acetylglucosamine 2-epimerase n=1 Tax=Succinivibrio dextrinosolvens TaxID=83771 RepID=UPI0008F00761|nr:UDP-N-acetylglucosamine 2-epimerase [Succinivibrio dextrinosolvens]SFS45995.1 GDP/UDP-N,N'-diacetylbacillosamine 2-epimerase (hydrolysing) [Succinivibrio dextrinosolvens]
MKMIAIVTTTRAEYGLLSPLIKNLRKYECSDFKVELIVTGTHLSTEFGKTVDEIDDRIDCFVNTPTDSFSATDIAHNQSVYLTEFTKIFSDKSYSALILLGDRYEILPVAIAACLTHTPIFHLCGGDTTEGAIDEWIRHSITKMSYLHFVTNEESRRRVIQLGEAPQRVFNYGSTSVENILNKANMSKEEALKSVGLVDCDYALCTYHPVTMEDDVIDDMLESFFSAIDNFPSLHFIITKSNADLGGSRINGLLEEFAKRNANVHVFSSLGVRRYLSLMKYSKFVLGNSSSGIIEAPCLHIPTVNIGDRQKGRALSESIINCGTSSKDIVLAMEKALSKEFINVCKVTGCPYGDGGSSEKISYKVIEVLKFGGIVLKKKFFDLV